AVRCHCVVRVSDRDNSRDHGDFFICETVRVALPVPALMMVANDSCNLGIVIDLGQDTLTNGRVFLHLPAFVQRQRSRLLEESGWKANLDNVMYEAAQVSELTIVLCQLPACCDLASINRDGCRLPCRVAIP